MKNLIYCLVVFVLLTACSPSESALQTAIAQTQSAQPTETPQPTPTPTPCLTDEVRSSLSDVWTRFNDLNTIANGTPRMSLSPVILDLNNIKVEANALILPECASDLKPYMVAYMDAVIMAYTEFMGQHNPDPYFDSASEYISLYIQTRDTLELDDYRLSGGIATPVDASSFFISDSRFNLGRLTFELSNSLEVPIYYVSGAFSYDTADGEIIILNTFYYSSIEPGEILELSYSTTQDDRDNERALHSIYITIESAYTLNP